MKRHITAEWLGRLKVIKTKDGKVEKRPRYEGEDLITSIKGQDKGSIVVEKKWFTICFK